MGQLTISLDDRTEQLVRRHAAASGQPASQWIAEAIRQRAWSEWPADVLALFGSWADEDFPERNDGWGDRVDDVMREEL